MPKLVFHKQTKQLHLFQVEVEPVDFKELVVCKFIDSYNCPRLFDLILKALSLNYYHYYHTVQNKWIIMFFLLILPPQ